MDLSLPSILRAVAIMSEISIDGTGLETLGRGRGDGARGCGVGRGEGSTAKSSNSSMPRSYNNKRHDALPPAPLQSSHWGSFRAAALTVTDPRRRR